MRCRTLIVTACVALAAASCESNLPTDANDAEILSTSSPGPSGAAALVSGPVVLAVTGSGHYSNPDGSLRTFSFHVQQQADGSVRGSFQLTGHEQPPQRWHGPLTCLSVVGNEAWIGGYYEKSTNPALLGTGFGFYVKDNGEGQATEPDLVRRHVRNQVPETWCATMPDVSGPYLYPIESGNVLVHTR